MTVSYTQRRKWFRQHKRQSLRQQRAMLQGQLNQFGPFAESWILLNRRWLFGRLKWAIFKR